MGYNLEKKGFAMRGHNCNNLLIFITLTLPWLVELWRNLKCNDSSSMKVNWNTDLVCYIYFFILVIWITYDNSAHHTSYNCSKCSLHFRNLATVTFYELTKVHIEVNTVFNRTFPNNVTISAFRAAFNHFVFLIDISGGNQHYNFPCVG